MTADYRRGLVKTCKDLCETAKGRLRTQRNKAVSQLKKKKDGVPEDDLRKMEAFVQDLTNGQASEIDRMFEAKEDEVMKA